MSDRRAREEAGLALTARACALVALAAPVLWQRSEPLVLALAGVAACWVFLSLLVRVNVPIFVIIAMESCAIAALCALSLPGGETLLPVLAVAPFIAGLWRGGKAVFLSLAIQTVVLVLIHSSSRYAVTAETVATVFTWLVTGMGFGLVASFFRARADRSGDDSASYREARALLRDLVDLSGSLHSGVDATVLAGAILDETAAEFPTQSTAIFIQRDGELIRLASRSSQDAEPSQDDAAAVRRAWDTAASQQKDGGFAIPMRVSGETVAVISGRLPAGAAMDPARLDEKLGGLSRRLEPVAVRLDTALLFARFRDSTMSDERRRMARELHDGVAQDVASMGYLVDALSDSASPAQVEPLRQLRTMITDVVSEVRRSVMALRTQAGQSESLGDGIAALARQLSGVSGVAIRVTTDERTSRLRHEVEAELLRITQEAMNNALKHAGATMIDVHCRVQAPAAEVTVRDDGRGLGTPRNDSHGLSIMRERAELIGATLEIESAPGSGTTIRVLLSRALASLKQLPEEETAHG